MHKTRSKLLKWGVVLDASCVFCGYAIESKNHLFHDYIFSYSIWRRLLIKMGIIKEPENTWDDEIMWCSKDFKGSSCVVTIKRHVLKNFL